MSITTQLCTVLLETCGPFSLPLAFRNGPPSTAGGKRHPRKPACNPASPRLFIVLALEPVRPVRVAETRDAPPGPCRGMGWLAPPAGFVAPSSAYSGSRNHSSAACRTSSCTLRITGLPEGRLECKKKMKACAPLDRLRAGAKESACRLHPGRRACRRDPHRLTASTVSLLILSGPEVST